ncbi:family 2 glycosyl transferase [Sphingomonas sp. LH128]|uniref:Family 2 glycosyl transferase n=1 Tax=Novosphingobium resinovorum TaxID=158500 RepID=A0A031JXP9_9SPHN|nr:MULTISPECIES: glycosyltransferase family 2 protein [Sphingomonadaceae]EJU11574.1 family 2 glycosyl transferase [Sphingomonas sp. LH128]EZP81710.1 Family 2 glycosyl transferase [Novosphingobium resinovorum]
MPSIHVVIATVGRAQVVQQTVDLLADQTRRADGVLVAAVDPEDVAGIDSARGRTQVLFSEKGLCRQRNRALDALENVADIIVFFDDDFVPAPNYLASVEALFVAHPELVGITGELRADGVRRGGFSVAEAKAILASPAAPPAAMRHRHELYGCNMSIRMSAARGMRFDENLPLYGWQEDIDFTSRLGRKGRQVSTGAVTGVHLGVSGGRTSGKRLGYSQVANVVYLQRKGTMRRDFGYRLMMQNLVSNACRSLWPEPLIDRRGRLLGNIIALLDCLRGRVDPRRILEM